MKKHCRAVVLAVLLGLLPANAWAACQSSDVRGSYTLYAMTQGVSGSFWTWCVVKIQADGAVISGSRCTQKNSLGSNAEVVIDGGTLRLGDSCKVTGSIGFSGFKSVVTHAWMNRDKSIIEGVGTNAHDASIFRFSAVRRVF